MLNVFVKKSVEELHVQLSDGRIMPLEDLVKDYERLLKEKAIISEPTDNKAITKLKVGEWFRIDREVINKNKEEIRRKCNEAEDVGKNCWKRFAKSNKIANENPEQYPIVIETYIFEHNWEYKTQQEMRDMCEEIGEGMCDEVICDLELQMRLCNGESVNDLFKKYDELPRVRVIKLRNGESGSFGGGTDNDIDCPPFLLGFDFFYPYSKDYKYVPYAFRRGLSQH